MPHNPKNFLSCVYLIGFNNYNKVYIGSTVRWPVRQREHINDLINNKHSNMHLQRAFNKYGSNNLFFKELEVINSKRIKDVRISEKKWITFYKSSDRSFGFNLVPDPIEGKGNKWTKEQREKQSARMTGIKGSGKNKSGEGHFCCKGFLLYDNNDQLHRIKNLKYFSEQNNLEYDRMYKVAKGLMVEYKGWRLYPENKSKRIKQFEFINPEGQHIKIENLRKFSKENFLNYKAMLSVNKERINCHQGWRKFFADGNINFHKGKTYILENSNTETITINNLKRFCQQQNICYSSLLKNRKSNGYKLICHVPDEPKP